MASGWRVTSSFAALAWSRGASSGCCVLGLSARRLSMLAMKGCAGALGASIGSPRVCDQVDGDVVNRRRSLSMGSLRSLRPALVFAIVLLRVGAGEQGPRRTARGGARGEDDA